MTVITFVSKEWHSLAAQGCDRLVPGMTLMQAGTCSTQQAVSKTIDDSFKC